MGENKTKNKEKALLELTFVTCLPLTFKFPLESKFRMMTSIDIRYKFVPNVLELFEIFKDETVTNPCKIQKIKLTVVGIYGSPSLQTFLQMYALFVRKSPN